jgi:hypothetical protein
MPAWRASRQKDLFNESPAAMMYCLNRFEPGNFKQPFFVHKIRFEERLAGDA